MTRAIIQFELDDPGVFQQLEALRQDGGFTTMEEMFQVAVFLVRWVLDKTRQGYEVGALDEEDNDFLILHMPFIDRARAC